MYYQDNYELSNIEFLKILLVSDNIFYQSNLKISSKKLGKPESITVLSGQKRKEKKIYYM